MNESPKDVAEQAPAATVAEKPHECGPGCKHGKDGKQAATPVMTEKDVKNLVRSKYSELRGKFKTAFVIQNTKTGVIAELKAASSFHACNLIGWKPQHTRLIETKEADDGKQPAEQPAA